MEMHNTSVVRRIYDYVAMSGHHLYDYKLSLKAKGLLSYMYAADNDIGYNDCYFWDEFNDWETWGDDNGKSESYELIESKKELYKILKELEQFGYLKHSTEEDEGDLIHYYQIFEKPHEGE